MYGIYDYLQISRFLNFFSKNKLIDLSNDEIVEGLKVGIGISKLREETNKRAFDSIFRYKEKDDDTIIYELIKDTHNTIESKKESLKVNKLIIAIKENNVDAINKTFKEYQIRKELFEHLNSEDLFSVLKKIENKTITEFTNQLESRYNFTNVKEYLGSDFTFLECLNNYINDYLKDKTEYEVKDFLFIELKEKITAICEKIK